MMPRFPKSGDNFTTLGMLAIAESQAAIAHVPPCPTCGECGHAILDAETLEPIGECYCERCRKSYTETSPAE